MKPPRVRLSGTSIWEPESPLTGFNTSKRLLPDVNIWLFLNSGGCLLFKSNHIYVCNPSGKQKLCLQSTHRAGTEAGGYPGSTWSGRKRELSLVACAELRHSIRMATRKRILLILSLGRWWSKTSHLRKIPEDGEIHSFLTGLRDAGRTSGRGRGPCWGHFLYSGVRVLQTCTQSLVWT